METLIAIIVVVWIGGGISALIYNSALLVKEQRETNKALHNLLARLDSPPLRAEDTP